ncbi:MAG: CatB-related O-acetyltransferase [Treponema sp.]|jgi:acetyltransferase-like isoleucine patch superfamily enzyme|nr:CatB-related O-acetyltransferase [Treponema sp.]
MFNTPVLFIIFNRLDTTKQVFSVIRRIKPVRLFIAADGPRPGLLDEKQFCDDARNFVLANIDWDCEVKTLFREKNLGCGKAVSEAITWFFEQVEQGIILEDDCVPALSFFSYCEKLLEKYKDDDRIFHISGYNPLVSAKIKRGYSYFFSRIEICWGWATWKRAWNYYNFNIKGLGDFISQKKIEKIFTRKSDRNYWLNIFKKMERHEVDTWDYQWTYTVLFYNKLCITPAKNLVSNIGYGFDATHTDDAGSSLNNQPRFEIGEIKHPPDCIISNFLVQEINRVCFGVDNDINFFFKKVKRRLLKKTRAFLKKSLGSVLYFAFPNLRRIIEQKDIYDKRKSIKVYYPWSVSKTEIGAYTYIGKNSHIHNASIGKFCSIGPNFFCGRGIHPLNGISTSPMFYSTLKQNGMSLAKKDKVIEHKKITIGNDVFVGANVTILDGVTVHDGAVIGAGAVVSKDIPPYAIAAGVPIKILRYRFDDNTIQRLLRVKWWDMSHDKLGIVEKYFFDIADFLEKCEHLDNHDKP